jgi:hypothetical protein
VAPPQAPQDRLTGSDNHWTREESQPHPRENLRLGAPKQARDKPLTSLGLHRDAGAVVHTLPTSLPTDLAEVVESWASLPPEVRAEVLGLIRSSLPTQGAGDE